MAQLSGRGGLIAASLLAVSAAGCGSTEAPAPTPEPVVVPDDPSPEPAYGIAPDPDWNQGPDEVPSDIYGMPPVEGEGQGDENGEMSQGPVDIAVPAYGIAPPPIVPPPGE